MNPLIHALASAEERMRDRARRQATSLGADGPSGLSENAADFQSEVAAYRKCPGHNLIFERLLYRDDARFSDLDLLEALLFMAGMGATCRPLAMRLLEHFGSLGRVVTAQPSAFAPFKELEPAAIDLFDRIHRNVLKLLTDSRGQAPAFAQPTDIDIWLHEHGPERGLRVLHLDSRNRLISEAVFDSPLAARPRDLGAEAIANGARSVILIHDDKISPAVDVLAQALRVLGVDVLDDVACAPGAVKHHPQGVAA